VVNFINYLGIVHSSITSSKLHLIEKQLSVFPQELCPPPVSVRFESDKTRTFYSFKTIVKTLVQRIKRQNITYNPKFSA